MINKTIVFIMLFASVLSGTLSAQTNPENIGNWVPFTPTNSFESGIIGMHEWLEAPAGKHGFLQAKDEKLVFEDG